MQEIYQNHPQPPTSPQVDLPQFTGPLDLLLNLIRREEMDIFDIDIHKITEQYLVSIRHALPDLDSAGDFIRISALLIYIKSKSLFPTPPTEQEPEDPNIEPDLERALKQSLLKMQVIQMVAKKLGQQSLLNKDVWCSQGSSALNLKTSPTAKAKMALLPLLKAYHHLKNKPGKPISTKDDFVPLLAESKSRFRALLTPGAKLKMSHFWTHHSQAPQPAVVLITFLTLLELCRLNVVSLKQEKEYSDIAILVKKEFNDPHLKLT